MSSAPLEEAMMEVKCSRNQHHRHGHYLLGQPMRRHPRRRQLFSTPYSRVSWLHVKIAYMLLRRTLKGLQSNTVRGHEE